MFGAPLVRATVMHHQRRPSASNLPSSSAVHAAIMATAASNKSSNGRTTQDTTNSATTAAKPKPKYAEADMQMFVDSPFVGGAMLSLESTSTQSSKKAKPEFNLKYYNPSNDPRLLAM